MNSFLYSIRDRVQPLCFSCILKVVDHLDVYLDQLYDLPPSLKDKLLHLIAKRGILNDKNIIPLLHGKVKILDLTETDEISNDGLKAIANRCKLLMKLDLNMTKGNRLLVTDEGLVAVARACRNLQAVYLRRCVHVSDESVVAFAQNCPRLLNFNLCSCQKVSDVSLREIGAKCRFLKSINLRGTQVTDEGVLSLVSGVCSRTLQELHLVECVHITDESVEAVLQFCPKIDCFLFHGCPLITDDSRTVMEDLLKTKNTKVKHLTWTIY